MALLSGLTAPTPAGFRAASVAADMNRPGCGPVRRGGAHDLPALLALERASFSEDAQTRRSLRWLLCRANALVLVSDAGPDRLAGALVLLFRRNSGVARIYSIAVDPAFRGQGLAEQMFETAVGDAAQRGCRLLRAEVRQSNIASLRFFERQGFERLCVLPGYYPGGEDGFRLGRTLAN
ncbi:MAG: GNAT family N-acetyltransferase [Salinisphaeraceae bacterium]|jgi:ribosomal protein S18 acetylase RimI-like enzyme|nr:GNAT family N-acetyltransferase [Salinisphaeraceae bacterium]